MLFLSLVIETSAGVSFPVLPRNLFLFFFPPQNTFIYLLMILLQLGCLHFWSPKLHCSLKEKGKVNPPQLACEAASRAHDSTRARGPQEGAFLLLYYFDRICSYGVVQRGAEHSRKCLCGLFCDSWLTEFTVKSMPGCQHVLCRAGRPCVSRASSYSFTAVKELGWNSAILKGRKKIYILPGKVSTTSLKDLPQTCRRKAGGV